MSCSPSPRAAARLSKADEARVKVLGEEYTAGQLGLEAFVDGLVAVAGRDAVVRAIDLSGFGAGGPTGEPAGSFLLSPRKVDSLLGTSLPLRNVFWDDVWPQLQLAGWTADTASRRGAIFFPPGAPSSSGGQPVGIEGIEAVLQHLQLHPDLLPSAEQLAAEQARQVARRAAVLTARPPRLSEGSVPRAHAPLPRKSSAGGKVCENCGTTSTPLWRKDRQANMLMCNACGIYYKHHGRHRPVELAQLPLRAHHGAVSSAGDEPFVPAASVLLLGGELAVGGHPAVSAARRQSVVAAHADSDLSQASDDDHGERRRSTRPRRTRDYGKAFVEAPLLEEEDGGSGAPPANTAGGEESDGGSELSSVQLVDETVAERQRAELINRLVQAAIPADFEGAVEGLKSLKRARITDGATGQPLGTVRVYADPAAPARARPAPSARSPAHKPRAPPGTHAPAPTRPGVVCANCGTANTPLWRKDRDTQLMMCNACGIYYKTHGVHRPLGEWQRRKRSRRLCCLVSATACSCLLVLRPFAPICPGTSRFKQYQGHGAQPRPRGRGAKRGGSRAPKAAAMTVSAAAADHLATVAMDSDMEEDTGTVSQTPSDAMAPMEGVAMQVEALPSPPAPADALQPVPAALTDTTHVAAQACQQQPQRWQPSGSQELLRSVMSGTAVAAAAPSGAANSAAQALPSGTSAQQQAQPPPCNSTSSEASAVSAVQPASARATFATAFQPAASAAPLPAPAFAPGPVTLDTSQLQPALLSFLQQHAALRHRLPGAAAPPGR